MVGLLDIGKLTRTVSIRGKDIPVSGIKAITFLSLLDRFKDLQNAMAGQKMNLSPAEILKLAPEVVAAIIAAGLGYPNDKDQEAAALDLLPGEQVDALVAILEVSIGGETGPFGEKLKRLGLDKLLASTGTAPDTKLPPRLNGSSGLEAIHPEKSGATPLEN